MKTTQPHYTTIDSLAENINKQAEDIILHTKNKINDFCDTCRIIDGSQESQKIIDHLLHLDEVLANHIKPLITDISFDITTKNVLAIKQIAYSGKQIFGTSFVEAKPKQ